MEIIGLVVALAAVIVAIGALFYSIRQTRELTKQTVVANKQAKVANNLTASSELRSLHQHLHNSVTMPLLQYPHLRKYFYDNVDDADLVAEDAARAAIIAEMFCDVLELGIFTTELHISTESHDDWMHFVSYEITNSRIIKRFVNERSGWWPRLYQIASELTEVN